MPTSTTVWGAFGPTEFHNIGALTATWTRPTDVCSTIPIAPSGISWPDQGKVIMLQVDNCGGVEALWNPECHPGGVELDKLHTEQEEPTADLVGYHSPGLHCPEAWETVGVIAMNNGTPSATGIFSPTAFTIHNTETADSPPFNFAANMLTSVLAPVETAIACCPSGYTADPYAGCYSQFPLIELANKTACQYVYTGDAFDTSTMEYVSVYNYTWAYYGSTTTTEGHSYYTPLDWPNYDDYETRTTTLGPSGTAEPADDTFTDYYPEVTRTYTGIALRQPVWLVHGGDGSEGNDEGEAGGSESESPSAARGLVPSPAYAAIFGVLAAWGVGVVAGVGLLTAW